MHILDLMFFKLRFKNLHYRLYPWDKSYSKITELRIGRYFNELFSRKDVWVHTSISNMSVRFTACLPSLNIIGFLNVGDKYFSHVY